VDRAADSDGLDTALGTSWSAPDRRRTLQLALATLWLVDAVLQLQPFMFSRSFGFLMLGPMAQGNPGPVGRPITDVAGIVGRHSVPTDACFFAVQLLIALAIANRRTVRIGLAVSILWSLLVWWFGEGLGQILTGHASPLTGAPGAVLIDALLAVVLWPAERSAPFVAAGSLGQRASRGVWALLWGALGTIALAEAATSHPAQVLKSMASGEPGWLAALDHRLVGATGAHGAVLAAAVGTVLLALALAGLIGTPMKPTVAVAVIVSLVIWVLGEDFGGLFTGSATDPNSGPLLVLFAIGYWPLRSRRFENPGAEAAARLAGVAGP
jgi:hypothetical protein